MKNFTCITILLCLFSYEIALSQSNKLVKIHIYTSVNFPPDFYTVQDRKVPIELDNKSYTLIETDMDTLKLVFARKSTHIISIPFEIGKSYYFQLTGVEAIGNYKNVIPTTLKEMTEREFLLTISLLANSYRRYSITKADGLKLVDQ